MRGTIFRDTIEARFRDSLHGFRNSRNSDCSCPVGAEPNSIDSLASCLSFQPHLTIQLLPHGFDVKVAVRDEKSAWRFFDVSRAVVRARSIRFGLDLSLPVDCLSFHIRGSEFLRLVVLQAHGATTLDDSWKWGRRDNNGKRF